jgi:hypothetical protein
MRGAEKALMDIRSQFPMNELPTGSEKLVYEFSRSQQRIRILKLIKKADDAINRFRQRKQERESEKYMREVCTNCSGECGICPLRSKGGSND